MDGERKWEAPEGTDNNGCCDSTHSCGYCRLVDNTILGWALALLENDNANASRKLEPATGPFICPVLVFKCPHPGCHAAMTVEHTHLP